MTSGLLGWTAVAVTVAVYCMARGITDLRAKRIVWGLAGIVSSLLILLTPIQTHAVNVDLPIAR